MAGQDSPKAIWALIILSGLGIVGGIVMTVANPADRLVGRLAIPAGTYGPILIAVSLALLVFGVVLLIRKGSSRSG